MVAISHTHEFIFIKTRKVAGTSIEMYLEPFCRPPGAVITERSDPTVTEYGIVGARLLNRAKPVEPWFNHVGAKVIRTELGAERFERYTKITAVRDPFDRAISAFLWQRTYHDQPPYPSFDVARAAFHDWAKETAWTDRHTVHVNNRYVADMTIRFEHLEDDLADVASALGLDTTRTTLPVTKALNDLRFGRPVADWYDHLTVERVLRQDAWVFARFGYPSSPLDAAHLPDASPARRVATV